MHPSLHAATTVHRRLVSGSRSNMGTTAVHSSEGRQNEDPCVARCNRTWRNNQKREQFPATRQLNM